MGEFRGKMAPLTRGGSAQVKEQTGDRGGEDLRSAFIRFDIVQDVLFMIQKMIENGYQYALLFEDKYYFYGNQYRNVLVFLSLELGFIVEPYRADTGDYAIISWGKIEKCH